MIKLIATIDKKRGIGKTGNQPWYIKADLKHFRNLTTGSTVLVGHKAYETIPAKNRPLPNRKNVLATHQYGLEIEGVQITHDAADYLCHAREDVWVMGGEEIFEAAMPFADELYLTQVDADFDCDKFFPPHQDDFNLVQHGPWQEEDGLRFRYEVYRRKPR